MCCVFIIILITIYMGIRVYQKKKYFTLYWMKEFKESEYSVRDKDNQNEDDNTEQDTS